MGKNRNWISIGISVVALVASIISVCVACYMTPSLGFDYMGFIVGILALLVTTLIGWNIYTIIDAKSITNKMKDLEETIKYESDKNLYLNNNANASTYYSMMFKGHSTVKIEYNFIQCSLYAIFYASKIKNFDAVNVEIKYLVECTEESNLKMRKRDYNMLLGIFDKILYKDKIPEINRLRDVLYNLSKYTEG